MKESAIQKISRLKKSFRDAGYAADTEGVRDVAEDFYGACRQLSAIQDYMLARERVDHKSKARCRKTWKEREITRLIGDEKGCQA